MATAQAHPKMNPLVTRLEAFFTTFGTGRDIFDLIKVRTIFIHHEKECKMTSNERNLSARLFALTLIALFLSQGRLNIRQVIRPLQSRDGKAQ